MEPGGSTEAGANGGISAVYQTLVEFTPQSGSNLTGILATKWSQSADGLSYTFNLRSGVLFHDNTPFNATAVKAHFDRAKAMKLAAFTTYLSAYDHTEIINNTAVKLVLNSPFAPFIYALANPGVSSIESPACVSAHSTAQDPYAHNWFLTNPVPDCGTGPYVLTQWVQGQKIVYNAFASYWGGWAGHPIQQAIIQITPQTSTAELLVQSGQADVDLNVQAADAANLNKSVVVHDVHTFNLIVDTFNVQRYPYSNPLVRQAFSYAFDYDASITTVVNGYGIKAAGPIPIGALFHDPHTFVYSRNLTKAAQLLQQAGWKKDSSGVWRNATGGAFPTFQITWQSSVPANGPAALLLQSNLQDIGIPSQVTSITTTQLFAELANATSTPDCFVLVAGLTFPDPGIAMKSAFHSTSHPLLNIDWYNNSTMDQLITQALQSADVTTRQQIYSQIQNIATQQALWIYAYQPDYLFATTSGVHGFQESTFTLGAGRVAYFAPWYYAYVSP